MTRLFLLISLFLPSIIALADVQINITAEVYAPPCTINNGQSIVVDFGNINLETVDNTSGRVKKSISVNCPYMNGRPQINVVGNAMDGQINVLATNIANFGIALYQGTGRIPIRLNRKTNNPLMEGLTSSTFTFTSVPFKSGSGALSPGVFKSTASMSIFYE